MASPFLRAASSFFNASRSAAVSSRSLRAAANSCSGVTDSRRAPRQQADHQARAYQAAPPAVRMSPHVRPPCARGAVCRFPAPRDSTMPARGRTAYRPALPIRWSPATPRPIAAAHRLTNGPASLLRCSLWALSDFIHADAQFARDAGVVPARSQQLEHLELARTQDGRLRMLGLVAAAAVEGLLQQGGRNAAADMKFARHGVAQGGRESLGTDPLVDHGAGAL